MASFLKKKMKQMEEIPERRLTETLLLPEYSGKGSLS